MSYLSVNCHHIHARNGQELNYDQVVGRARIGMWLNMAGVEIVCPSAYVGGSRERSYGGDYALVSMQAGDSYVVEGAAAEIADHVTGTTSLRRVQLEKLQNVGGNVLVYGDGYRDAWIQPDAVEAIEKSGYHEQGFTDGVTRAMLLLRSGAIVTLYGVSGETIAIKTHWYRG